MALSDSDLAFEGLEDTLEEIRATDAHYITTWDWSQLRNHRRLELIDIHQIAMYTLDQQLPAWKSLKVGEHPIFIEETRYGVLRNLDTPTNFLS